MSKNVDEYVKIFNRTNVGRRCNIGEQIFVREKAVCPVCKREFTYTKVRTSQLKVEERERDFILNIKMALILSFMRLLCAQIVDMLLWNLNLTE